MQHRTRVQKFPVRSIPNLRDVFRRGDGNLFLDDKKPGSDYWYICKISPVVIDGEQEVLLTTDKPGANPSI